MTDVANETPTGVEILNAATVLREDIDTTTRVKVADIRIADQGNGTNSFLLLGSSADLFEVEGGNPFPGTFSHYKDATLYLKQGVRLTYTPVAERVTIVLFNDIAGSQPLVADYDWVVQDVNDAPMYVGVYPTVTSLPENADTTTRRLVAQVIVNDDAIGENTYTVTGTDAALFEVVKTNHMGADLYLKAGAALDYETRPTLSVGVSVQDLTIVGSPAAVGSYTLTVTDIPNAAPTAVTLENTITVLPETTDTAARIKVADINILDDGDGINTLSLSGSDAVNFEIIDGGLYLKAGVNLDFEAYAYPWFDVFVTATDFSVIGSSPVISPVYFLSIGDVNDAPSTVFLNNAITSLAENTTTSSRVKVGDIVIRDDSLGSNTVTLTGPDAHHFETVQGSLYLKAGTLLNFEGQSYYQVTINATDLSLVGTAPVTRTLGLTLTDVNEGPTAVALDNVTASLPENLDTATRRRLADIVVTDRKSVV